MRLRSYRPVAARPAGTVTDGAPPPSSHPARARPHPRAAAPHGRARAGHERRPGRQPAPRAPPGTARASHRRRRGRRPLGHHAGAHRHHARRRGDHPLTTAPAPAPGAGTDTPVPPPYLIPGASAQQQPISRVAALSEPAVPAEPLRLAALAAALLAVLLVALTTLLRALGVRTPVTQPAVAPADSRLSRLGERLRGTADDMRDFLRRSR